MMYNSSRELAQKMDSEGGLADFAFGYGLDEDDLPDDLPGEVHERLLKFLKMRDEYAYLASWLYERLEDEPVPGDYDYEESD